MTGKCLISIADLVLIHNRSMEGLYCKLDMLKFDFWSAMMPLKQQFLKYCKPFEK